LTDDGKTAWVNFIQSVLWRVPIGKLSGGRIVEATIKAVHEMTKGTRLQVSFGNETALIYLGQVVKNG
jgi:hypothetical protein